MLVWIATWLLKYVHALRVFDYLTFRAIGCALTALFIGLLCGPFTIRQLQRLQIGQSVRSDGPQSHLQKAGTPTMGGVLILIAMMVSILLWSDLHNAWMWLALLSTLCFGAVGFVDDYRKVVLKNSKGLISRWKYLWLSVIAIIALMVLIYLTPTNVTAQLFIPFMKNTALHLGVAYWILGYFIIVGSSNAVNLTDGLDGLAILPVVLVAGALGVFAYITGNIKFATYLEIPYIAGVGELGVFCSAIIGAGLGFLWYNAHPAKVFMGDVGSLSLGGALGLLAMMVKQEIVFALMGGIFVVETLSVIAQVASFKLTGKRIFRMAPLHHHFELKGWNETQVVVRFWLITFVLVLCGLATLKLR